jgi:hypothetical protein
MHHWVYGEGVTTMDGGEASQPISDFDSIEAPAAGTMTVPIPKKPLLISFVQLVLYASIVLCIVVIVRNLLSLFGSTMSPDGLLSLILSTLGVGLITGCLWLLHLAVEARLRIARVGLAVLVLVASGFLILGSDDGGPRYQERVRNWESGNSLVDPFSPEYAAGIVCGKLTRGIIAVAITLGLLFGRKSKEYLTNSLSERERSRPQTEWRFELQWMLASSIGWAVGFFMVQVVRRAAISIMSYILTFALGFLDAQFDRTQASGMPAEFIFVGEAVVQTAVGAVLGGGDRDNAVAYPTAVDPSSRQVGIG